MHSFLFNIPRLQGLNLQSFSSVSPHKSHDKMFDNKMKKQSTIIIHCNDVCIITTSKMVYFELNFLREVARFPNCLMLLYISCHIAYFLSQTILCNLIVQSRLLNRTVQKYFILTMLYY